MKKIRIAALSLTLSLTVGICTPAQAAKSPFTDVPADHWAMEAMNEMAETGIMTGVGDSRFAPNQTVSYAEFITMIMRQFYPEEIQESNEFYWSSGNWWSSYIYPAYRQHLLSNTELYSYLFFNPKFEMIENGKTVNAASSAPEVTPETAISRYDMATIIYEVVSDKFGIHSSGFDVSLISDYREMNVYQRIYVDYCFEKGFLTGIDDTGTFNGEASMTRAEAAAVMSRLINADFSGLDTPQKTADAFVLTQDNVLGIEGDGSYYKNGVFHLENGMFIGVGGWIEFINENNYSTLTFTVTVNDLEHNISVFAVDSSLLNDGRLIIHQGPGTTKTYTVDISGVKRVEMGAASGMACDVDITDIYLLP